MEERVIRSLEILEDQVEISKKKRFIFIMF